MGRWEHAPGGWQKRYRQGPEKLLILQEFQTVLIHATYLWTRHTFTWTTSLQGMFFSQMAATCVVPPFLSHQHIGISSTFFVSIVHDSVVYQPTYVVRTLVVHFDCWRSINW